MTLLALALSLGQPTATPPAWREALAADRAEVQAATDALRLVVADVRQQMTASHRVLATVQERLQRLDETTRQLLADIAALRQQLNPTDKGAK